MSYDDSHYDRALICRNGHVVNSMARDYPSSNSPYCASCGEPTISKCPNCNTDIRGYYHVPGVIGFDHYNAPAFCHQCGKLFPWTQAALSAAKELINTFDTISGEEKVSLEGAL